MPSSGTAALEICFGEMSHQNVWLGRPVGLMKCTGLEGTEILLWEGSAADSLFLETVPKAAV